MAQPEPCLVAEGLHQCCAADLAGLGIGGLLRQCHILGIEGNEPCHGGLSEWMWLVGRVFEPRFYGTHGADALCVGAGHVSDRHGWQDSVDEVNRKDTGAGSASTLQGLTLGTALRKYMLPIPTKGHGSPKYPVRSIVTFDDHRIQYQQ